jgi:branched-chain amino acid transport system permease protein
MGRLSVRNASLSAARLGALIAPLGLIVLLATQASGSRQITVTSMLIDIVLVVGLQIFIGNSGVLSFGHMSFMAIGAYVGAILTIPPLLKSSLLPGLPAFIRNSELATAPAIAIAAAVAAAVALVVAIPLMRLSGIAASLSTFAFLLIIYTVASNWNQVTRGRQTMLGVPANTTMFRALVGAIVAILIAYAFQGSSTALRLRASREDDVAATASGVWVARERTVAFVISAAVVAVGGFLFAQQFGVFNPDEFYLSITFITIAMLVIGGMKSLAGAVVGPIVVTAILEGLRNVEDGFTAGGVHVKAPGGSSSVGLALIMLAILLFRPAGLMSGRSRRGRWRRRLQADDVTPPARSVHSDKAAR